MIRESVILTGSVVAKGAKVEHVITDKQVHIGENVRMGAIKPQGELSITMIGKNSRVPPGFTVEPGAVIGTDVVDSDYSSSTIRGDEYVQTKRAAYEF